MFTEVIAMQLIPVGDAEKPRNQFPPVYVGETLIGEDDIAREMQHHPAEEVAEAWHDAPDIVRGFLPTPAALATLSVVTMLTRCHRYASTAPELAATATR